MKKTSPHHRNQPLLHSSNYTTDATNALQAIPSDLPREEWIKLGMAFQASGGEFDDFNVWSSTASNYNLKDAQAVWRSFAPNGGITAGTLFHIAQKYGYCISTGKSQVNPVEAAVKKEQARQRQLIEEQAKQRRHAKAMQQAESILDNCEYSSLNHPYLLRKVCEPQLVPWIDSWGRLVIPVMDLQGNVHSLQYISSNGKKKFLSDGAVKGNFYQLWAGSDGIVICEGYATGVTLCSHYVPNCSVIVAFDAGKILAVARVIRTAFPEVAIIIAGDNDNNGSGQKAAIEAAQAVNGSTAIPVFDKHEMGTDWNDRWCLDNGAAS